MESTELLATPQQLHVQPTQRITREMTNANEVQTRKETTRTTRGMASTDENTKQQIYTEYNDATGKKIKVTGPEDDIDFYVMHACIQSDPGEPMKWKDTLYGH